MTSDGGLNDDGTIFKILPDGTGSVKLLDFNITANGAIPEGDLLYDGTFPYGLAPAGGSSNGGILFKIRPDGTDYTLLGYHDKVIKAF